MTKHARYAVIVLSLILMVGMALKAQAPKTSDSLSLSELEKTKLQLVQEKQKSNAAQAALIRQAFTQNQEEGRKLVEQEQQLIQQVCGSHGLSAEECSLGPDDSTLIRRTAPKPPAPKK